MNNTKYLLCFFILTIPSLIKSQETNWQLKKNEDGIKVYTREVKGSSADEFKSVCTYNAKPEQVLNILLDASKYTEWMPNVCKSKLLKRISANVQIDYIENKAPWPVKNRDIVSKRKIIYNKNGSITIEVAADPDFIPEKDNIVRIKKMKGFWKIIPEGEVKVKVIFQVLSDPGGNIPAWLVNTRIVDTPFESLQGLGKVLKEDE